MPLGTRAAEVQSGAHAVSTYESADGGPDADICEMTYGCQAPYGRASPSWHLLTLTAPADAPRVARRRQHHTEHTEMERRSLP